MADSYTAQGFTKPEPGGSLNTWGTKLNVVIDMMAAQNKFAEVQIAGNTSVTFTNASASATALPTGLKLTANGVTAAFTFSLPATPYKWVVENVAGYTATLDCGGAATVTLPTGFCAMVAYSDDDGDIRLITPSVMRAGLTANGQIKALTAGTLSTDAVNLAQMQAAISVLAGAITGGLSLVSINDTAAGYLASKIIEGYGIDLTDSGAGNATLTVAVDPSELLELLAITGVLTATISSGNTTMTDKRRYRLTGGTATIPVMSSGSFNIVELAPAFGVTVTIARNGQNINGTAQDREWIGTGATNPVMLIYHNGSGVRMIIIGSTT